jgi:hypothetical protein
VFGLEVKKEFAAKNRLGVWRYKAGEIHSKVKSKIFGNIIEAENTDYNSAHASGFVFVFAG